MTSEPNSRFLFFWEEFQYIRLKNELFEINSQITEDISNRKLIKILFWNYLYIQSTEGESYPENTNGIINHKLGWINLF